MSKVTVSVATEEVSTTGIEEPGPLRISILTTEGVISHTQDIFGNSAEFVGVVDGDYVITAARVDVNGLAIGNVVRQEFKVLVEPVVTFQQPSSLNVSVSAD